MKKLNTFHNGELSRNLRTEKEIEVFCLSITVFHNKNKTDHFTCVSNIFDNFKN